MLTSICTETGQHTSMLNLLVIPVHLWHLFVFPCEVVIPSTSFLFSLFHLLSTLFCLFVRKMGHQGNSDNLEVFHTVAICLVHAWLHSHTSPYSTQRPHCGSNVVHTLHISLSLKHSKVCCCRFCLFDQFAYIT